MQTVALFFSTDIPQAIRFSRRCIFICWDQRRAYQNRMNSASTQFVPSRRMGIYEPMHQMSIWEDFKESDLLSASPPMLLPVDAKLDNQSEDTSHGTVGPSRKYEQEGSKPDEKVLRRLAQNREAARKSRMRKKAYIQQLENSKLRLIQLEQELGRARRQGSFVGNDSDTSQPGHTGTTNPAIAKFEMEYGRWVEEHNKQISDLRNALHCSTREINMQTLVDAAMRHYSELFTMKARAAEADVFHVVSGMWKTPAERFFFWIGGFQPSEILKILLPHLELLLEQQRTDLLNLRLACHQAEDALSQGMDKLQHFACEALTGGHLGEGNFLPQVGAAMNKLEDLVLFVSQADHLREETLLQISRILTPCQMAQALLAIGEYLQRLRALSSCWSSRLHDKA